jgi:putative endonuclease
VFVLTRPPSQFVIARPRDRAKRGTNTRCRAIHAAGVISFTMRKEHQYFVYIITNGPYGTLYVGVTNDLLRRIYEHREGLIEGFSKRYGSKTLVYFESFEMIHDAIHREKRIKKWSRQRKIDLIMTKNPRWDDLYEATIQGVPHPALGSS